MRPDQVTRYTRVQACSSCGVRVLHHQVVRFEQPSGFKTYAFEPTKHRCEQATGRGDSAPWPRV